MNKNEFKNAVGKFPTGICVITTNHEDKLYGFTANSFASVSLSPALISFCLSKEAGSFDAFFNNHFFCINILASDQSDVANHFATKNIDKFQNIDYKLSANNKLPIINGALSVLECSKFKAFECGDHYIFVGEVQNAAAKDGKDPLLYYGKSYKNIEK